MQVLDYYEKDGYSPSITNFQGDWIDISTKEQVMDYLLAYEHYVATKMGSGFVNGFTGGEINESRSVFSDGMFEWTGDLPFYVRNFNVILPDHFIQQVLSVDYQLTPMFDWQHYSHPYPSLAAIANAMSL